MNNSAAVDNHDEKDKNMYVGPEASDRYPKGITKAGAKELKSRISKTINQGTKQYKKEMVNHKAQKT
jgi:hypothetical protein